MPFHKKVFKKIGGVAKKVNPFGKIADAIKPKNKPKKPGTSSFTGARAKPKKRMNKSLPSGVRVRLGRAPTGIRRPLKVRPKAKRLSAQPFGRKKVEKKVGPRARRRPRR